SNTRATARMPRPSASAPTAHTSLSGATRVPCNGVPWLSWKEPPQLLQCSWRQGPPLGCPLALILPDPTQPRQSRLVWGQKCDDVSTWRGRPRVGTRRGGGPPGGWGPCAWACAQAAHGGLRVRPGNGFRSRECLRGGGRGLDGL